MNSLIFIPQVEITGLAVCIEIILVVARAHPSPAHPIPAQYFVLLNIL